MVESTINELIKYGATILDENNVQNPILEAQIILALNLNEDRLYVLTNVDEKVKEDVVNKYINDILRRCSGEPTQYITKMQEFMSLKFKVNEAVLIPRPDTEILVEQVVRCASAQKVQSILDVGTGSGCIAVSLAKYIDNAVIHAVDISETALEIAKFNAELNGVEDKVVFYKGNLFSPFETMNMKFDVIVSNPPYIPTKQIEKLDINVKDYEPRLALDGGEDGLDYYRKILKDVDSFLKKDGLIFFEIDITQAGAVKELLRIYNFTDILVVKDLAGLDRVVQARKL